MKKLIIDTDVCSDDAAALLFALKDPNTQVLAITTVSGGVSLEQATLNALMTCEVAGADVPVYKGAAKGLFREPFATTAIHGADGMGQCGLIHPTTKAVEDVDACDAILRLVRQYPYEIDLVALAPMTNIGLAILKDRDTMRKLRSITVMGTGGFGPGNITPVAEANVFTDAESFDLLLSLGVPTDIRGLILASVILHSAKRNLMHWKPPGYLRRFMLPRQAANCFSTISGLRVKVSSISVMVLPWAATCGRRSCWRSKAAPLGSAAPAILTDRSSSTRPSGRH